MRIFSVPFYYETLTHFLQNSMLRTTLFRSRRLICCRLVPMRAVRPFAAVFAAEAKDAAVFNNYRKLSTPGLAFFAHSLPDSPRGLQSKC